MPRCELDFLPENSIDPTDEQLFLQLVYGLCGQLNNPREEASPFFVSSVQIPNPHIRRLAKLLVERLQLPIPVDRVDKWIEWQRTNQCWVVNVEMSEEARQLAEIQTPACTTSTHFPSMETNDGH